METSQDTDVGNHRGVFTGYITSPVLFYPTPSVVPGSKDRKPLLNIWPTRQDRSPYDRRPNLTSVVGGVRTPPRRRDDSSRGPSVPTPRPWSGVMGPTHERGPKTGNNPTRLLVWLEWRKFLLSHRSNSDESWRKGF